MKGIGRMFWSSICNNKSCLMVMVEKDALKTVREWRMKIGHILGVCEYCISNMRQRRNISHPLSPTYTNKPNNVRIIIIWYCNTSMHCHLSIAFATMMKQNFKRYSTGWNTNGPCTNCSPNFYLDTYHHIPHRIQWSNLTLLQICCCLPQWDRADAQTTALLW